MSAFTPCSLRDVAGKHFKDEIKFYGRISGFAEDNLSYVIVEDRGCQLIVDCSGIDSIYFEIGAWYRFLGEKSHSTFRASGKPPTYSDIILPVVILR